VGSKPTDDRLLATFLDLVRIDSPSGEEADCAAYCASALGDIGFTVTFDDSAAATGSNTGNLIASLPGDAPQTLVLSAHLDCVEPCRDVEPVVADGVVFSAGETVLGADDKAGLAAIIEAARRLTEDTAPRPTIRCVLTVQEEVGLTGAKALAPNVAWGDLCLVLDAAGMPGGIVVAAPTHYTFTAVFSGVAAHAGVVPEKGVSALRIAADAIMRMELGRLDADTTANVGTVHGGTATNVVAAQATMTGECRSLQRARVETVREAMHGAMVDAALHAGGTVEIEWTREYEGFQADPDSAQVRLVSDSCVDAGLSPQLMQTGGGSDANIFAGTGMPTLALACGMEGVHGTTEQIAVSSLEQLTDLVVAVARRMAGTRS